MTLKASGISKRFNNNWALRDVSFEMKAGTVLGVFGPSGCGKSTLLSIIAGEESATTGTLSAELTDFVSSRKVCMVRPESGRSLFAIFGSTRATSGQVRTDAVEAALASDADAVLLDEALSHLDQSAKRYFFENVRSKVLGTAKCVVYASANFDDILELCDSVIVLEAGYVVQTGTPQEVYCEPSTSRAAILTGRTNLFEARRLSSSKAETPEFQTITGSHRLIAARTEKAKLGALNQNILLSIRPEYVSISFGASFPEDNLLKATITSVKFLGPNTLVECDADGLRIHVLVMRLVGLSAGDECMLGLPPERITILSN